MSLVATKAANALARDVLESPDSTIRERALATAVQQLAAEVERLAAEVARLRPLRAGLGGPG